MAQHCKALDYIHNVDWKGKKPTLDRTSTLLERMGNPQKSLRFVHIAGTNGKGSTASVIASILQAAGYRTGLFTSPYLMRFHERMRVNGEQITDQELDEITDFVRPLAETMQDHPSEFDLVSCIGLEFFARKRCDIVVLEVGMGGRLDSTNAIDPPEVAVITAIGLDHTEYLGDTVEKIAAEKAGIIKPSSRVVLAAQQLSIVEVVRQHAAACHAPLVVADPAVLFSDCETTLDGERFVFAGEQVTLALIGAHQRQNAAVALASIEALRARGWSIPASAVKAGLASARWAGRFELLCRQPTFFVDGGHNPQGAITVFDTLSALFPSKKITFLTGVLSDKDGRGILLPVLPIAGRFYTVTPESPRALSAEALAKELREDHGIEAFPCASIAEGVRRAISEAAPDDVICAYGSLYQVGEIRRCFDLT